MTYEDEEQMRYIERWKEEQKLKAERKIKKREERRNKINNIMSKFRFFKSKP